MTLPWNADVCLFCHLYLLGNFAFTAAWAGSACRAYVSLFHRHAPQCPWPNSPFFLLVDSIENRVTCSEQVGFVAIGLHDWQTKERHRRKRQQWNTPTVNSGEQRLRKHERELSTSKASLTIAEKELINNESGWKLEGRGSFIFRGLWDQNNQPICFTVGGAETSQSL